MLVRVSLVQVSVMVQRPSGPQIPGVRSDVACMHRMSVQPITVEIDQFLSPGWAPLPYICMILRPLKSTRL